MGHVYGEVIIEGVEGHDINTQIPGNAGQYRGKLKIPFKNENIAAYSIQEDETETVSSSISLSA